LSELIDVAHDRDPAHRKLHIGLYIAAFKDAIDRAAQLHKIQQKNAPSITPKPIKRRAEGEHSNTKRPRLKMKDLDGHIDAIYKNMDKTQVSLTRTT
jgi:hypothetical protein